MGRRLEAKLADSCDWSFWLRHHHAGSICSHGPPGAFRRCRRPILARHGSAVRTEARCRLARTVTTRKSQRPRCRRRVGVDCGLGSRLRRQLPPHRLPPRAGGSPRRTIEGAASYSNWDTSTKHSLHGPRSTTLAPCLAGAFLDNLRGSRREVARFCGYLAQRPQKLCRLQS